MFGKVAETATRVKRNGKVGERYVAGHLMGCVEKKKQDNVI